jgi:hypothetical protein
MTRRNFFANGATALAAGAIPASAAEPAANRPEVAPTNTRRVQADGTNVFYREGPRSDRSPSGYRRRRQCLGQP